MNLVVLQKVREGSSYNRTLLRTNVKRYTVLWSYIRKYKSMDFSSSLQKMMQLEHRRRWSDEELAGRNIWCTMQTADDLLSLSKALIWVSFLVFRICDVK